MPGTERREGLQKQTRSATLELSYGIAFLPPKSGILLIEWLTIIGKGGGIGKNYKTNFSQYEK